MIDNVVISKCRKITASQAASIIMSACQLWRLRLAKIWGADMVLNNPIEIAESFYQEMRKACTIKQNDLFDIIFGKDEVIYPDGTPCLVRQSINDGWHLRYADGEGKFYMRGHKSGEVTCFKCHQKLDMNNLPVND